MPRHTKHFERSMDKIKAMLHGLSARVEESLRNAMRSLTERDRKLGAKVISDDERVDGMEVELEEECLKVLALHQPVANDLRLVISILKINNDLERIGDLAVNLAERAVFLADYPEITLPPELSRMAEKTFWMLNHSMDALVALDPTLARKVCAEDDEVDDLNRKMYRKIEAFFRTDPDCLEANMQLLSASRYLERVADHATNIAEDVIYLVGGEIVRHRKEALLLSPEVPEKRRAKK